MAKFYSRILERGVFVIALSLYYTTTNTTCNFVIARYKRSGLLPKGEPRSEAVSQLDLAPDQVELEDSKLGSVTFDEKTKTKIAAVISLEFVDVDKKVVKEMTTIPVDGGGEVPTFKLLHFDSKQSPQCTHEPASFISIFLKP